MFSSIALADDPTSAAPITTPTLGGALPMLLVILVFYVLIIRPNQKKLKEHDQMVKGLRRGDKIVTAGGVVGVISKVEDDNMLLVEIAEGVQIRVVRETIANVLNKTVANDNKADKNSDKEKSTGK